MQVARLAFMKTILAFTGVIMMTGEQGCCSGVLIGTWKHMHPISLVFDLNMYLCYIHKKQFHKDTQTYSGPNQISTNELFS